MPPPTEATRLIASRLLIILDAYSGISVRETQLVDDYQLRHNIHTAAEAIREALVWMEEKEWCDRRNDPLRGRLVTITAPGKRKAETLNYESL